MPSQMPLCLFLLLLGALHVSFPHFAEGGSDISGEVFADPGAYLLKTITVKGTCRSPNPDRRSFSLQRGDRHLEVICKRLPPSTQRDLFSLPQGATSPVTVKGMVMTYGSGEHYYISATHVQLKPAPRENTVAHNDVLLDPAKYVNQQVTISGRLTGTNPQRRSFVLKHSVRNMEVLYRQLPKRAKSLILSQDASADTPVKVTGRLIRFHHDVDSYYLLASGIQINGEAFAPPAPRARTTFGPREPILLDPGKYVNTKVDIHGTVVAQYPERKSFTLRENDRSISVSYSHLPQAIQAQVAGLDPSQKIEVTVRGMVIEYRHGAKSYYINATRVRIRK